MADAAMADAAMANRGDGEPRIAAE